jgi:hypothetical protein
MRRIVSTLLVAGALLGLAAGPAAGPAAAAGSTVGPHQYFAGLVNGRHSQAAVLVACPGPIIPGQTGHPFANQPLEVLQAVAVPGGFTGSAANRIVAYFAPQAAAVIYRRWFAGAATVRRYPALSCSGECSARRS